MTSANRLTNFQAVRWAAASLVVASHIYLEASRVGTNVSLLSNASTFADLGVALFFVLSGWLMAGQMMQPENPLRNYLQRRIIRIVPLYALVTVGVVGFQIVISHNVEPVHWALSFLFLSQALGLGHPILYVGWTLEYEMFFYVLVGGTLLLKNVTLRFMLSLSVLVLLSTLSLLPPVVMYFAWGIAGHFVQLKLRPRASKMKAAFLTLFIVILLAFQVASGMQVYANVAILGLEIAILFFALTRTWQIKSWLVGLLGDSSYAQYLVHVPVLTIVV